MHFSQTSLAAHAHFPDPPGNACTCPDPPGSTCNLLSEWNPHRRSHKSGTRNVSSILLDHRAYRRAVGGLLAVRSQSERRRQPLDVPRRLQDDSKTTPGRSKMLQDAPSIPRRAQDVPRHSRDAPRFSQNTLKTSSRRLQDAMLVDLGA